MMRPSAATMLAATTSSQADSVWTMPLIIAQLCHGRGHPQASARRRIELVAPGQYPIRLVIIVEQQDDHFGTHPVPLSN